MKQKFKAIVAAVLVMASLFAMASLVSAGFVEEVFSEVCELMSYSSSNGNVHSGPHLWIGGGQYKNCEKHGTKMEVQVCKISSCTKEYWPACPNCQSGN